MMNSTSESSEGASAPSPSSRRCASSQKHWKGCWPGAYVVVFAVNAAATALNLFLPMPCDVASYYPGYLYIWSSYSPLDRVFFVGLELASFGCGFVAAFLLRRAGASVHARSACGYAVTNWLNSVLGSSIFVGGPRSMPGVADERTWYLFRLVIYLLCLFWMQMLIAQRLDLLEQTSQQKYWSWCFRKLVWAQGFGVSGVVLSLCLYLFGLCSVTIAFGMVLCTWLCHVAASVVAILSLTRSFLQLRWVLRLAKIEDAPVPVRSSLKRARRFSGLQTAGVSSCLVLTILAVPAAYFNSSWSIHGMHELDDRDSRAWVVFLARALDFLGHALAVLLLSGSHRLSKQSSQRKARPLTSCTASGWKCPTQPKAVSKGADWSPSWEAKVEELSLRGMTLNSLLRFYQEDLPSIPDWIYMPREHLTRDVVRRAIIPLTSREESAYAASALNRDGSQRASIMVTHSWSNTFKDLLAAVISDALHECSFKLVANLLSSAEDCVFLSQLLADTGRLGDTYWICAFAVNQHTSICHSNPYDRDPLTNQLHPVCSCSSVTISDPDGLSPLSEINKFDDMMYHLASTGGCRQLVAVDEPLGLFQRAWCMAEIAEAKRLQMKQSLKLPSKAAIELNALALEHLDVRNMRASSDKDKELILSKITTSQTIEEFNEELQSLIFAPKSGLLAAWQAMDSLQQMGEVGRLIRWGLADAGSGKVWNAWEADA